MQSSGTCCCSVEIKNVGSDCTKSVHDACKYLDDNNDGNENDENHKSRCWTSSTGVVLYVPVAITVWTTSDQVTKPENL